MTLAHPSSDNDRENYESGRPIDNAFYMNVNNATKSSDGVASQQIPATWPIETFSGRQLFGKG